MQTNQSVNRLIIVAALGYFVDIFDLVLFNVVKQASFKDLNLTVEQIKSAEITLFNFQMTGMLLGGLLWGILGDRIGRLAILFGSITIYSIANIANGFVHDTEWYGVWRFIAGLGLAGELGAGITIVSETIKKERRGIGTMIIVSVGALGAVGAYFAGKYFDWRNAYIIGGAMGFALLILRIGTFESSMFEKAKQLTNNRGNFLQIITKPKLLGKYLACILIGVPIWYAIGIMINLSNRYGQAYGLSETINVGESVMFAYLGLCLGDILSGYLSQVFKSRKKVIAGYLSVLVIIVLIYHLYPAGSTKYFKWMAFVIGLTSGYWALFALNAAEQFGTNIRSTVANTVPNFVRFAVVPLTLSFDFLSDRWHIQSAGLTIGILTIGIAFWALSTLKETFYKDLDYLEGTEKVE